MTSIHNIKHINYIINFEKTLLQSQYTIVKNNIEKLKKLQLKNSHDLNNRNYLDYWHTKTNAQFKSPLNDTIFKVNTHITDYGIVYGSVEDDAIKNSGFVVNKYANPIYNFYQLPWVSNIKKIIYDLDRNQWILINNKIVLLSTNEEHIRNMKSDRYVDNKFLLAGTDYYPENDNNNINLDNAFSKILY